MVRTINPFLLTFISSNVNDLFFCINVYFLDSKFGKSDLARFPDGNYYENLSKCT